MALKGNLRDFSITQLLNLINLAQKTGMLVIEGPGETARISFRQGKLAYAQLNAADDGLAFILAQTRKISQTQYKLLKERTSQMTDKELGLLLINAGYLTQDAILTSLQTYFVGIVRRLFTWVEGYFRFEADTLPADGKISVRVDLENLIIEGSRGRMARGVLRQPQECHPPDRPRRQDERPGNPPRGLRPDPGRAGRNYPSGGCVYAGGQAASTAGPPVPHPQQNRAKIARQPPDQPDQVIIVKSAR
jgi:hypothetical protein